MITGENNMTDYKEAQKRTDVSIGESVKIIRELQGLNQNELSSITGIPQSTLSAIEHDKVNLGVEKSKSTGQSFKMPSCSIGFPWLGCQPRDLCITSQSSVTAENASRYLKRYACKGNKHE
jgi:transcriptional regulator with XRE-family HTH domain